MERNRMGIKETALSVVPGRGAIIRRGLENILRNTEYQYPRDFIERMATLAQDGYTFVLAANHTSHADAYPLAKVGGDLARWINPFLNPEQQIKGFLMPFALSMSNNGQGKLLDFLFKDSRSILDRFGVEPVFTATANDIKQGRVEGSNSTEFTRNMIKGVREGKGIIVFPEGRVEGGRRDENGGIKGVQEFAEGALSLALRISVMEKDKVALIPVGISGGYNVYNPHRRALSKDAFMVGLGISSKRIFRVKVGSPILYAKEELKDIDPHLLDTQVGAAIAARLPAEEQGIYRGRF